MAAKQNQNQKLLYACLAGTVGFVLVALGIRIFFLAPTAAALTEKPPREYQGGAPKKTEVAGGGSNAGLTFSSPTYFPLPASPLDKAKLAPINRPERSPYPAAALLVEAEDLTKPEFARCARVLDTRPRETYQPKHVRGAVWVDVDAWSKAFAAGKELSVWEKKIGALGIDLDTPVIVYDHGPGKEAAHLWWILRYWGVKDVRLLHAGWHNWLSEGFYQDDVVPEVKARPIELQPDSGRLCDKYEMLQLAQTGSQQIIDARSFTEFRGDAKKARRNGAIPSAKHLEWSSLIDWSAWRFKSPQELTKVFRAAGIDPSQPVITYCHSGNQAAAMAFALELMGSKDVRVYYRGWQEWGNAEDTPVVANAQKR